MSNMSSNKPSQTKGALRKRIRIHGRKITRHYVLRSAIPPRIVPTCCVPPSSTLYANVRLPRSKASDVEKREPCKKHSRQEIQFHHPSRTEERGAPVRSGRLSAPRECTQAQGADLRSRNGGSRPSRTPY